MAERGHTAERRSYMCFGMCWWYVRCVLKVHSLTHSNTHTHTHRATYTHTESTTHTQYKKITHILRHTNTYTNRPTESHRYFEQANTFVLVLSILTSHHRTPPLTFLETSRLLKTSDLRPMKRGRGNFCLLVYFLDLSQLFLS